MLARTAALCAAVLMCGMAVTAYAGGGEEWDGLAPVEPLPTETVDPGEGFTEDGNLVTRDLLYDKATNKQFITVQTSGGNTFYIVIDYDKPTDEDGEQYQTYFLNIVDEADLLAAMQAAGGELPECSCADKCAVGAINTDCTVCAVNMGECQGKAPEPVPVVEPEPDPEPEQPKSTGNGGMLLLALAVLFAANLFWGSVVLTPGAVLAALTGKGQDALALGIITQLRLPRAVMVVLLGAALSAAGYLLQTFFANPIAGPFVMGISSGAKLVVALTMVVFLNHGLLTNSLTLILAAFAGSMAAMAFVLSVARRVHRMSILVICGVMIGYICSAVTDIVVAFAQDSNIVNLHNWSQGSFSGMTWGNVAAAALVVLPCLAAAFLLAKPMAAYQMGEQYAQSVGVAVRPFCVALVLLSSLLAACVTAFAGPISFVGIAVPHLVKQALGSAKPLHVLPGCALGGAAFCLLCDLIARSLFAPTELSISSVTAVFGAPVVIWLLVRRQSGEGRA